MHEYPKALYKGNKRNHEHVIAEDKEHEQELRDAGHVDHAELEDEPVDDEKLIDADALVTIDQFDAISEKLADTEEQLATVRGEFNAFQNNVAAMKERIAEIHGDTDIGKHSGPNYTDWTAEQLREAITKQGKEFKARDSKAELIAILEA